VAFGLSGRQVALGTYAAQMACSTIAIAAINAPGAAVPIAVGWLALGVVASVAFAARRRRRAGVSG
jgi:hypothetical protein